MRRTFPTRLWCREIIRPEQTKPHLQRAAQGEAAKQVEPQVPHPRVFLETLKLGFVSVLSRRRTHAQSRNISHAWNYLWWMRRAEHTADIKNNCKMKPFHRRVFTSIQHAHTASITRAGSIFAQSAKIWSETSSPPYLGLLPGLVLVHGAVVVHEGLIHVTFAAHVGRRSGAAVGLESCCGRRGVPRDQVVFLP